MPATCCELLGQPSRLYIQLQKEFPEVPIVPLQRRVFNEAHGLDRIKQLVAEQFFSVVHLVTTKYYSLAAAAALIKYLELVQSIIFTPRTVKIEFQVSENSVMIGKDYYVIFTCVLIFKKGNKFAIRISRCR